MANFCTVCLRSSVVLILVPVLFHDSVGPVSPVACYIIMSKEPETPFLAAAEKDIPTAAKDPIVHHEAVSDGPLMLVGRWRGWLSASYTRPDCRCGHCPISDPDPCPYALPPRPHEPGYLARAGSLVSRSISQLGTQLSTTLSPRLSARQEEKQT